VERASTDVPNAPTRDATQARAGAADLIASRTQREGEAYAVRLETSSARPVDELRAKLDFIRDKVLLKVKAGWWT
jgi:hypothetical protein